MPSSKHPLRVLRAATPHATQAAFAAFLGVPAAVLQAVESGRVRMTSRFASLVREMTGADDVELLRGTEGRSLTLEGRRYAPEAFAAWQGSGQQRMETARRLKAEQTAAAAWERLAAQAGGAGENYLVPWQTCETA